MPSSPRTPRKKRRSSSASISITPTINGNAAHHSHSRKNSISSISSPPVARRSSLHDYGKESQQDFGSATYGGGDTLGNLADELAEAWEEGDEMRDNCLATQLDVVEELSNKHSNTPQLEFDQDTSYYGPTSPLLRPQNPRSLSPPKKPANISKHRRKQSRYHDCSPSDYSGSEYGSEIDLEPVDLIPPSLEAALSDIEHLARIGTSYNGSQQDAIIPRFSTSLRDLTSQVSVENATSRLITAHISLNTHISHQIKALQNLIQPFLLPNSPASAQLLRPVLPDSPNKSHAATASSDDLCALLTSSLLPSLLSTLPRPSYQTTPVLHSLRRDTEDLTTLLSSLSDFLHESRHNAIDAQRRLRSAKDMLQKLREEEEAAERGRKYVDKGEWERRLREREAGKACRAVVEGFEGVCGVWRDRLLRGGQGLGVLV